MRQAPEEVRAAAMTLREIQREHAARSRLLAEHLSVAPPGSDQASCEHAAWVGRAFAAHYAAERDANRKMGAAADALLWSAGEVESTDQQNAAMFDGRGPEGLPTTAEPDSEHMPYVGAGTPMPGARPSDGEEAAALPRRGKGTAGLRAAEQAAREHAAWYEECAERLGSVRSQVRSGMDDETGRLVDGQLQPFQAWASERPGALRGLAEQVSALAGSHETVVEKTHPPERVAEARERMVRLTGDYRKGDATEPELADARKLYRDMNEHNRDAYGRHLANTPDVEPGAGDPAPDVANPAAGSGPAASTGPQRPVDGPGEEQFPGEGLDDEDEGLDDEEEGASEGEPGEGGEQQLSQIVGALVSGLGEVVSAVGSAFGGAASQGAQAAGQAQQGAMSAVQGLASAGAKTGIPASADLDEDEGLDDGLDGFGAEPGGSTLPMGAAGGPGGSAVALSPAMGDLFDGPAATRAAVATGPAPGPGAAPAPSSMLAPPMMGAPAKAEEKERKRPKELSWSDEVSDLSKLVPTAGPHGQVGPGWIGAANPYLSDASDTNKEDQKTHEAGQQQERAV